MRIVGRALEGALLAQSQTVFNTDELLFTQRNLALIAHKSRSILRANICKQIGFSEKETEEKRRFGSRNIEDIGHFYRHARYKMAKWPMFRLELFSIRF